MSDASKRKALQNALIEGEQSGAPQELDFDDLKARKRAEFSKQPK